MDGVGPGEAVDGGGSGQLRPLIGASRPLGQQSWVEVAADRRDFAEGTLRELGFREATVRQRLSRLDDAQDQLSELRMIEERPLLPTAAAPGGSGEGIEVLVARQQREAVYEGLWGLVRGVKVRREGEETATIWVPLFVLSAPDVVGCSAGFDMRVMTGRALGWKVTIIGGGLSGAARFRTTSEYRFKAGAGEAKQVLLPVEVTVVRCTVLRRGRPRGQTYETYVTQSAVQAAVPKLLEEGAVPGLGELAQRFALSVDPSRGLASYSQAYERTGTRSHVLGLRAFGSELGVTTEVEQDHNIALTLDLTGGYDYAAYYPAEGDGVLWADPVGPSVPNA